MPMKRPLAALAVACSLAIAGCNATAENWRDFAIATGAIVGETRIDPRIEKVSAKLAEHCVTVQTAAIAVDLLAPPKVQAAAQDARAVVASFCAAPPRNVSQALVALASAYVAIEAARAGR